LTNDVTTPGIVAARIEPNSYTENFDDVHKPLNSHEAFVAADRCYFCYDAPCVVACPTEIDIPLFIRQISTGTPKEAAKTIFAQNILGGMCARVCPTETLCEEACVREAAEGKPVEIGKLQRYATDKIMEEEIHPFQRGQDTGKKVAVVGAGPAGLACAHRLSIHGHKVDLFEAKDKLGGLNEYGIAAYKTVNNFAEREVRWLLKIGGITPKLGMELSKNLQLADLKENYDAVFLAIGLGGVNKLSLEDENAFGVLNAVDFISELRQADDLKTVPIGRNVVVVGGGMTAVDAAIQSKLLGAENVTIVYRRGLDQMSASLKEREHATSSGVRILTNLLPKRIIEKDGKLEEIVFAYAKSSNGRLEAGLEEINLKSDQIFKAIGQTCDEIADKINGPSQKVTTLEGGRISGQNIWAGGDCSYLGEDLTVTAVAQGRDAAEDINRVLNHL
jgi:dihydropyrimidine dehydrogenase (NAD+) subunit PreT